MKYPTIALVISMMSLLVFAPVVYAGDYSGRKDVDEFIAMMSDKHGYNVTELKQWFARAAKISDALQAITRPAESKPWYQYRRIFITDGRIEGGIRFWKEHADTLKRAEEQFGVPAEIIVAIIGVETYYGKHKGRYPVFDTLVTLGFDYPRRGEFFRRELEEYLLLVREEKLDPFEMKGSYAGAVGKPQFISSSYRHYAVDFDGDGKRDLLNNTEDAIGSVANYFRLHKWKPGEPIIVKARFDGSNAFPSLGMKPVRTVGELSKLGIFAEEPVKSSELAQPIRLELKNGYEYHLGLHNFYVITRYNHSNLYAMAVYELSQLIKQGLSG